MTRKARAPAGSMRRREEEEAGVRARKLVPSETCEKKEEGKDERWKKGKGGEEAKLRCVHARCFGKKCINALYSVASRLVRDGVRPNSCRTHRRGEGVTD